MINTIIVPTDGSGHANKAIDMAGEIAVKFGARVVVVQALLQHATAPDLKAICQDIGVEGDVVKEIDELAAMVERVAASGYPQGPIPVSSETLRRVGERIAEKAHEALSAKGVQDVTTQVVDGDPASSIIAAAEHEKAELVVMGRRGLGNVAGLVMGSVSHKVAHLAECACLTVK